jgi:hypothetical protein
VISLCCVNLSTLYLAGHRDFFSSSLFIKNVTLCFQFDHHDAPPAHPQSAIHSPPPIHPIWRFPQPESPLATSLAPTLGIRLSPPQRTTQGYDPEPALILGTHNTTHNDSRFQTRDWHVPEPASIPKHISLTPNDTHDVPRTQTRGWCILGPTPTPKRTSRMLDTSKTLPTPPKRMSETHDTPKTLLPPQNASRLRKTSPTTSLDPKRGADACQSPLPFPNATLQSTTPQQPSVTDTRLAHPRARPHSQMHLWNPRYIQGPAHPPKHISVTQNNTTTSLSNTHNIPRF